MYAHCYPSRFGPPTPFFFFLFRREVFCFSRNNNAFQTTFHRVFTSRAIRTPPPIGGAGVFRCPSTYAQGPPGPPVLVAGASTGWHRCNSGISVTSNLSSTENGTWKSAAEPDFRLAPAHRTAWKVSCEISKRFAEEVVFSLKPRTLSPSSHFFSTLAWTRVGAHT